MLKSFNFRETIPQFLNCVKVIRDTPAFIKEHKLWRGFLEKKWILFVTLFISCLFTYTVYQNFLPSSSGEELDIAMMQAGLSPELEGMMDDAAEAGKGGARYSGIKYLLIVFLEVIIFYFSVKTLNVLSDREREPKMKDFMKAELRMLKVMGFNFIKGVLYNVLIWTALSIAGMGWLTKYIMFFVYAYFLGYAFLDNYNEQFVKTIKNSQAIIRQHFGASLALGLLITGIIFIPLVGPIVGPIFGGIAGAIYGERFKIENTLPELLVAEEGTSIEIESDLV